MRAAVCRAFGEPLTIEEVELDGPNAREVRLKLAACAVCHSDITYMEGGFGGELPLVFGHEAAGVVVEVGAGVDDVAVGDHAVVTLIRSCGTCRQCRRGHQVGCTTRWPLDERSPIVDATGERLGHGLRTGGFAEQVVVDRSQLVVIGDDIPLDSAALLACGGDHRLRCRAQHGRRPSRRQLSGDRVRRGGAQRGPGRGPLSGRARDRRRRERREARGRDSLRCDPHDQQRPRPT